MIRIRGASSHELQYGREGIVPGTEEVRMKANAIDGFDLENTRKQQTSLKVLENFGRISLPGAGMPLRLFQHGRIVVDRNNCPTLNARERDNPG